MLILLPLKIDIDWPSFRQTILLLINAGILSVHMKSTGKFDKIYFCFEYTTVQIFDLQEQAFL